MKLKIFVIVLALVFVAAACNKNQPTNENTQDNNDQTQVEMPPATSSTMPTPDEPNTPETIVNFDTSATISMNANGFEPSTITIKKGSTVTFVNNDKKNHWPASAPHPIHTDYPAFDPRQAIAASASWSFTFDQAGTWKFHDHLNPSFFGSVTVEY
ncbi:MAG: hypothetical protein A3B10_00285 [Candidatus Doudnabacteria bacterium RIFCSPLOWO2_01_FULL_44_21]|uniref:EfeO-type cupredoxin-like domain-containing protein n=1 Tax=Candidatus Doudnabacteria bacterium RIFCSPLOWO2_01_FULL_44_21 TaxID=1817841 RepID=A0A1F5PXE3_9BACT|nr:MAG: hypothetical protein A3B95_03740 [Candidatus Doudnabacteria bacterium RIFCSPHIGHO2_02_FULL_43_13b]OGE94585.1 MAG: hypothetical protein A3B10_00285 [Candidatus Doudnabacteria bacterium RIFCSPLOWO2_01_FULL_44_21]